jgi:hypothetical protein
MSATILAGAAPRSRRDEVASLVALSGAALGVLAGSIELAAGPHIRAWVGEKQDTTRLGVATITLSLIALAAAAAWRRQRQPTTPTRFLVATGLLIPGLVCFTTVGRLWYVPGVLLLMAAGAALADLRTVRADVRAMITRNWLLGLTALLAIVYILLGVTALGLAGALGILGGIAILAALATAARMPRRQRPIVLAVAAAPFAALTWWSVITPLLAILIVTIGSAALMRATVDGAERFTHREIELE